ncbi:hypothetical protein CEN50_01415 [Fischerella thermalis CCMEE 5268]|uniref:Uncharacterized protein n=1 Tax=Fischerella thermalis CCMEE 5268 TaxID=2019662 RepID=A0A2N6KM16_9CYAN|nr:hypothetical protein CEN50_01415 [Fischerella thermalis CCMEE 5268]
MTRATSEYSGSQIYACGQENKAVALVGLPVVGTVMSALLVEAGNKTSLSLIIIDLSGFYIAISQV